MVPPVIGLARDERAPRRAGFVLGVAAAATAAVGCGGSSPPPAVAMPRPAVAPTEDLAIDLATTTLEGTLFVPEGLPPPAIPVVRPRRKISLDKQRLAWKKVAADGKAPLARRASEAQVLVTLLLERMHGLAAEDPKRAPLLAEARAALTAVHSAAHGQADRTTVEMAAALALGAGDGAAAAPLLDELVVRFPGSGPDSMARAQLAFVALVAGQDAAAATALAGLEPTATSPDLAYVIAWLRFRAGDGPGAAAAIATAAAGWKDDASRPAVVRDYQLLSARGGVAPAAAADGLVALGPTGPDLIVALVDLGRAYDLAGRPDDADAALAVALDRLGASVAGSDQVAIRRMQAEYAREAGRIADLGGHWRAVLAALDRCTDCGDAIRHDLADELARRAYELHTIHVTSGDARAKAAALELYRIHAGMGEDAAVAAHARELASAHAPEDGSQYDEALHVPIVDHLQQVLACYEARLQGERKLGGALTVRLEVDQAGLVSGVTTEPAGGLANMAAVATCVESSARTWSFPTRPRPGVARISLPFVLGARL